MKNIWKIHANVLSMMSDSEEEDNDPYNDYNRVTCVCNTKTKFFYALQNPVISKHVCPIDIGCFCIWKISCKRCSLYFLYLERSIPGGFCITLSNMQLCGLCYLALCIRTLQHCCLLLCIVI